MTKKLRKVNTRQRRLVAEDGTLSAGPVSLYLDPRGDASFVFNVPSYVCAALGVDATVEAATAVKAEEAWNALVVKYAEHVRTARAEPVILLIVEGRAENADGRGIQIGQSDFSWSGSAAEKPQVGLSISYELAFRVNGNIHYREEREEWGNDDAETKTVEKVGHRYAYPRGIVLDYTKELHATLDSIIATISKAGLTLNAILKSKDVAAALMKSHGRLLPAPKERL